MITNLQKLIYSHPDVDTQPYYAISEQIMCEKQLVAMKFMIFLINMGLDPENQPTDINIRLGIRPTLFVKRWSRQEIKE